MSEVANKLPDHIEKLHVERFELKTKIANLYKFLGRYYANELPPEIMGDSERFKLLQRQLKPMLDYLGYVMERIDYETLAFERSEDLKNN